MKRLSLTLIFLLGFIGGFAEEITIDFKTKNLVNAKAEAVAFFIRQPSSPILDKQKVTFQTLTGLFKDGGDTREYLVLDSPTFGVAQGGKMQMSLPVVEGKRFNLYAVELDINTFNNRGKFMFDPSNAVVSLELMKNGSVIWSQKSASIRVPEGSATAKVNFSLSGVPIDATDKAFFVINIDDADGNKYKFFGGIHYITLVGNVSAGTAGGGKSAAAATTASSSAEPGESSAPDGMILYLAIGGGVLIVVVLVVLIAAKKKSSKKKVLTKPRGPDIGNNESVQKPNFRQ